MFWYETLGTSNNHNFGQIKRAECSGANVMNITAAIDYVADTMIVDSYDQYLYWYDKRTAVVIRLSYDGSNAKPVLHFEVTAV